MLLAASRSNRTVVIVAVDGCLRLTQSNWRQSSTGASPTKTAHETGSPSSCVSRTGLRLRSFVCRTGLAQLYTAPLTCFSSERSGREGELAAGTPERPFRIICCYDDRIAGVKPCLFLTVSFIVCFPTFTTPILTPLHPPPPHLRYTSPFKNDLPLPNLSNHNPPPFPFNVPYKIPPHLYNLHS